MATKSRRQGTGNTGERGVDMTTVVCGNCRRPLDDDTGAMPEARKPCPDCGSTARRIVPAWWAGEELEPALSGRSMMMRASGTATLELISARVPPITDAGFSLQNLRRQVRRQNSRAVSDLLLQAVIVAILRFCPSCAHDVPTGRLSQGAPGRERSARCRGRVAHASSSAACISRSASESNTPSLMAIAASLRLAALRSNEFSYRSAQGRVRGFPPLSCRVTASEIHL